MPSARHRSSPSSGFTEPGYRPRIIVIGGANTDFLIRATRLPRPGETITGEAFDHAEAGGKGANQGVAAARLGARVAFIGRIGADERGRALLRRLKDEHIDVRHVVKDPHSHTGVAQIGVDASGEKHILVAPGANQRLTAADVRRPAVARAIANADLLLLQFEVPLLANLAAARIAHRAGVPIVLDPAPALVEKGRMRETGKGRDDDLRSAISHPLSALLSKVTILRANEHEAEALTGIRVEDRNTAKKAAEHLLKRHGLRTAIIAAGKGNLAVWRDDVASIHSRWLPRLRVKAIDATGAGDAFAAALAVAFAEGNPIPEAATFANAAAALATTKLGAQPALPKRAAVLAILKFNRRTSRPLSALRDRAAAR